MTALLPGTRVLELGTALTAYCGRAFADLGADVVLVEPPAGSPLRRMPPLLPTPAGAPLGAEFAYTAAGKRSVTLDLTSERDLALAHRLVAGADVVLTDAPPGGMEELGLGHAELRRRHPGLVYVSVTPLGLTGPRRRWHGSDLTTWAATGVMPGIGDPDRVPLAPPAGLARAAAGYNGLLGALAALTARDRTGSGQLVDVSGQEAALSVTLETAAYLWADAGRAPGRSGKRRAAGPAGHFRTQDGAVVIVAFTPWQWDALAGWIAEECGLDEARDGRYRGTPSDRAPYTERITALVEALTLRYGKQEFTQEAQRRGIPSGPVNTVADLLADPHLQATGGWTAAATADGGQVPVPASALVIDGHVPPAGTIPDPGQHDGEVWGTSATGPDARPVSH